MHTKEMAELNKRAFHALFCASAIWFLLTGCSDRQRPSQEHSGGRITSGQMLETKETTEKEENTEMNMTVQIGSRSFTASLEDNAAVAALLERMEEGVITLQMSDYAGFEKVGALGTSLPSSDRPTTTQAGDIVLYQGDQIVLFYGSNSWNYTRLGQIEKLNGWQEALGNGDVSVTFSLEE